MCKASRRRSTQAPRALLANSMLSMMWRLPLATWRGRRKLNLPQSALRESRSRGHRQHRRRRRRQRWPRSSRNEHSPGAVGCTTRRTSTWVPAARCEARAATSVGHALLGAMSWSAPPICTPIDVVFARWPWLPTSPDCIVRHHISRSTLLPARAGPAAYENMSPAAALTWEQRVRPQSGRVVSCSVGCARVALAHPSVLELQKEDLHLRQRWISLGSPCRACHGVAYGVQCSQLTSGQRTLGAS
mmetsp:Transcript_1082/g.3594  ORF Transcript_1082/g.3594 Transcript_1082/m.3594 type:complete len:245 (-) Transcript_1082:247-981(-)